MLSGRFNVVTDGQWGSCGKGLITTALADRHRPEIISTTNMSNAGHTAVNIDGEAFVAKALPSAAILKKWCTDYSPAIVVGASSAYDMAQMLKEIEICGVQENTHIHPRAGVILDSHKQQEASLETGTKHIASTMQGCGAFLADKVMRRKELKLSRDYPELQQFVGRMNELTVKLGNTANLSIPRILKFLLQNGQTALHEGSQGFSLDINHGSHYPQCTSRGTTAVQNVADMGIGHSLIGDIYLVIRPYPIRVGNVIEDGNTVGYSGDCYDDHSEITWAEVAAAGGAPPDVMKGELTTVTKRLRRVFTFSKLQLLDAVAANGATKIALNFANYIDWSCYGTNDYNKLPSKVKDFILDIEDLVGLPVTIVGTGPQTNHVCFVE